MYKRPSHRQLVFMSESRLKYNRYTFMYVRSNDKKTDIRTKLPLELFL